MEAHRTAAFDAVDAVRVGIGKQEEAAFDLAVATRFIVIASIELEAS
jgi:hypothetical protein